MPETDIMVEVVAVREEWEQSRFVPAFREALVQDLLQQAASIATDLAATKGRRPTQITQHEAIDAEKSGIEFTEGDPAEAIVLRVRFQTAPIQIPATN